MHYLIERPLPEVLLGIGAFTGNRGWMGTMARLDWRKPQHNRQLVRNREITETRHWQGRAETLVPVSAKFRKLFELAEQHSKSSPQDYAFILSVARQLRLKGFISQKQGRVLCRLAGLSVGEFQ
jgi:hypothetical protein